LVLASGVFDGLKITFRSGAWSLVLKSLLRLSTCRPPSFLIEKLPATGASAILKVP
jgi:hypothetical protein